MADLDAISIDAYRQSQHVRSSSGDLLDSPHNKVPSEYRVYFHSTARVIEGPSKGFKRNKDKTNQPQDALNATFFKGIIFILDEVNFHHPL